MRLILAATVLVDHAFYLGGFARFELGGASTPGTLAVYGFFGISGYLITGSALRSAPGSFLRHRFLRIFPGFWAALAVTAFAIAPLAFLLRADSTDCRLGCFFSSENGPVEYVWRNAALWIFQPSISGTPANTYLPDVWNGSLWTLSFEFGAYLIVLGLALVGLLRRRRAILALTGALWLTLIWATVLPVSNTTINFFSQPVLAPAMMLLPIFFAGATLRLYRDRIPDSAALAAASLGAAVVVMMMPIGASAPGLSLTSGGIAGPLLVYPVLWLGAHLRETRIGRRNDYSYGVYVYAFPVTQFLAILGLTSIGWPVFVAATMGLTGLLAVASWKLIERPAMGARSQRLFSRASTPARRASPVPGRRGPAPTRSSP
ncbi:MAG: acyltransferase [Actinobacteria bacterium]|nr:acyltransferase [Actinomycetota bacterium]MCB9411231.1 acyltransferase [Actinomycetota bacterium]